MKWIGSLLFLTFTTWIGFEWSSHLNKRPTQIRQLKNALQILEAEIMYSQSPLQEVFSKISKQIPKPTNAFFQNLCEQMDKKQEEFISIWERNIGTFIERSSLSPNEAEILKQFGQTLGQHDFIHQQKHIHLTITHLDRELEEARDQQQRYAKMVKSLGFLCGLFIVLLIV